MNRIHELIQELKKRPDVGIIDNENSWAAIISGGKDLICEVIIPHEVLEWHASVKRRRENKEIWSDWMDYSGYNDLPKEKLEAEMADDLLAFITRMSESGLRPPYGIYQENP